MEHRHKILVIEDVEMLRHYLCEMLEYAGFTVHGCDNGTAALKAATKERFHIVIVDFRMPGMNGVEATKQLRVRFPECFIIGVSSEDKRAEFLNAGADTFLQKPYGAKEIVNLIHLASK